MHRYYSYGAQFNPSLWSAFRQSHNIVQRFEGDNDGLVSVTSAKWGIYKGTLANCNHLDVSISFFLSANSYRVRLTSPAVAAHQLARSHSLVDMGGYWTQEGVQRHRILPRHCRHVG